jgi:hypothetical protein
MGMGERGERERVQGRTCKGARAKGERQVEEGSVHEKEGKVHTGKQLLARVCTAACTRKSMCMYVCTAAGTSKTYAYTELTPDDHACFLVLKEPRHATR